MKTKYIDFSPLGLYQSRYFLYISCFIII